MARTTVTLPSDLTRLLEGAVAIGAFDSKSDGIQQALGEAFEDEQTRVAAVRALHDAGEVDAQAAFRLADVSDDDLQPVLADDLDLDRNEVEPTTADLLETIHREFSNSPNDGR